MRVTVICPPDHPVCPGAEFAYALGRVQDGVHNVLHHTGEQVPMGEFMLALADRAREEFPGHEVRLDVLVEHPDRRGEAQWIPAMQFDPEKHVAMGAGRETVREFTVSQDSQAGAG